MPMRFATFARLGRAKDFIGHVILLDYPSLSPDSSGDRASASGAEGRWFESSSGYFQNRFGSTKIVDNRGDFLLKSTKIPYLGTFSFLPFIDECFYLGGNIRYDSIYAD